MNSKKIFLLLMVCFSISGLLGCSDHPLPGTAADLDPLTAFIRQIELGDSLQMESLNLFPVVKKENVEKDRTYFMVTDEAMQARIISVGEHDGGQVDTLGLDKQISRTPVFMMGGEILSGAKQDRILSQDMLLPAHAGHYLLKVYCVEAGRWVQKSKKFETRQVMGTAKLRKTVAKKETQSQVWNEVGKKSNAMNVNSSTAAMLANYDDPRNKGRIKTAMQKLDQWIQGLKDKQELVGMVVTVKGEIISLDAFRNEELFLAFWPKLSKSVALDAMDPSFKEGKIHKQDVEQFMASLKEAVTKPVENPGLGLELSIAGSHASGAAHVFENRLNHVNLFPEEGGHRMRVYQTGDSAPAHPDPAPVNGNMLQPSNPDNNPFPASVRQAKDAPSNQNAPPWGKGILPGKKRTQSPQTKQK